MVKISNKVLLAGGLATAIGFTGCKKYEDGPYFSLLTKKQRLTGDWEATKLISSDGQNMIDQGVDVEIEFDNDGDFKLSASNTYTDYYGQSYTYTNNLKGDWEFSNDKEEVELDYDDGFTEDWEITRLTNKEFEANITSYMKKKLFPQLELNSKSDTRIELEKQ